MTTFLIGADPELFVKQDNRFVSAHGLIPGTKIEPFKVDRGAVQVDGCALEFNIDPANNVDEFVSNIKSVGKSLRAMVPNHEIIFEPVAHFDPEYFNTQVPAEAKELGCEPDYNAYTGEANPRPEGERPFRTASGHIHIGWTNDVDPYDPAHFADCMEVVKQLDFYVGVPSLLWDRDNTRRSMYGKAGAFRPKSYGCEYRVLSNRWLTSDALMKYVYNNTIDGMNDLMNGKKTRGQRHGDLAKRIIDANDVGLVETAWSGIFGSGQRKPALPKAA